MSKVGQIQYNEYHFGDLGIGITLDSRQSFGPITVRYESYGQLNSDCSNAILIFHAFSGDAHAAGRHQKTDKHPGWWDAMIGPDCAFDTNRFCIICSNVLGGCQGTTGPASINPKTEKEYGLSFPVITIHDMVKVQKKLMEHLGIERWYAIAGASMGGMQAMEWLAHYPKNVERAIIIAAPMRLHARDIAFTTVGRQAIMSDPNWNKGNYYGGVGPHRGLSIARMMAHITYSSEFSLGKKFGRKLQKQTEFDFSFEDQFAIESYLQYQGMKFVDRFDANSYLYLSKSMEYYNMGSEKVLDRSMSQCNCRFLIISFTSDWRFPASTMMELVRSLVRTKKDVSFVDIDCPYGHDSFLLEQSKQTEMIYAFLEGK